LSIDRFAHDTAPPWEDKVGAPDRAKQDLRLLHMVATLSERTPERMLRSVSAQIGPTISYERLRAGARLPNAVRAELKDILDEQIRREIAIGEACVAHSRDLTRLILAMNGLVLLSVVLLVL